MRYRLVVGLKVAVVSLVLLLTACEDISGSTPQGDNVAAAPTNTPSYQIKIDPTVRILMQSPPPSLRPTPTLDYNSGRPTPNINVHTPTPDPDPDPTLIVSYSVGQVSLPQRAKLASEVISVKVEAIQPLVWDTPDGQKPDKANAKRKDGEYYSQMSPLSLSVVRSFKGSYKPGQSLTILFSGAPGSHPYGERPYFPKLGGTMLLLLNKPVDYRKGLGKEL